MLIENNKSFWDEIQGKYEIVDIKLMPAFYAQPGMVISFELKNIEPRPMCPVCSTSPNIHGYKAKKVIFGTLNGVPVTFEMKHSRYICKNCDITFMDEFENLPNYQRMSTDAENYIISKLGYQAFSEIASDLGVSVQTIVNRAKKYATAEKAIQLKTNYCYISMDEVFISRDENGKGSYYWLLNDISSPWKSNNIRIELGRKKDDVIKRLLELNNPEDVMAVCIDMWKPYRDAILEALPQAEIVIDPFHVIKLAQTAMKNVRKKANVPDSLATDMKKDEKLFLTSIFKVSDDELDRLELYLQADTSIEKSYFILQELLTFYHFRDYDMALDYLAEWESDVLNSEVEEMIDILHTVQNWLPYIMNYFIHRITNGKTEGKNHLLRAIDKMGFHYGLESMQACLYAHDRKQEYKKWQKYQRKLSKRNSSAA